MVPFTTPPPTPSRHSIHVGPWVLQPTLVPAHTFSAAMISAVLMASHTLPVNESHIDKRVNIVNDGHIYDPNLSPDVNTTLPHASWTLKAGGLSQVEGPNPTNSGSSD